MTKFTISEKEAHTLAKCLSVAFHSINHKLYPTTVKFTDKELQRMLSLQSDLGAYVSYLEDSAQDHYFREQVKLDFKKYFSEDNIIIDRE